ncbi:MAG TPA: class I SAM-dependent methyltransferase, partial [Solirubrobacterales bacterium]|nr:class I SAM-dependent methyltransferase [Solirubrobacterales bacterium]
MTDAGEWQGRTGDSWAAEWRRTDRSFGPLTEHLLKRSREFAFGAVLDVGCGAGELSLAIARGRPRCRVVGVDISPQLVAAARERGANHANVAFEVADAAVWRPADDFAPDLLVSRHGVMFFDRPVAAFAHLAGLAAPGAGLLFSCFRAPAENPFFTEVGRLLPQAEPAADPHAPGPFAFADAARVAAILADAGWTGVACEPFDLAMVAGAGEDPVADAVAYFSRIGPAARA